MQFRRGDIGRSNSRPGFYVWRKESSKHRTVNLPPVGHGTGRRGASYSLLQRCRGHGRTLQGYPRLMDVEIAFRESIFTPSTKPRLVNPVPVKYGKATPFPTRHPTGYSRTPSTTKLASDWPTLTTPNIWNSLARRNSRRTGKLGLESELWTIIKFILPICCFNNLLPIRV